MAELDTARQSLTLKIVYYGPALSGKTTNLQRLHDLLSPELKGEVMTLDTRNERTLFFDLVPMGFRAPSGLLLKFKLFTVPGQAVERRRPARHHRAGHRAARAGAEEPQVAAAKRLARLRCDARQQLDMELPCGAYSP